MTEQLPPPDGIETDRYERATYWAGDCEPYGCAVVEDLSGKNPAGMSVNLPEWITDAAAAEKYGRMLIASARHMQRLP